VTPQEVTLRQRTFAPTPGATRTVSFDVCLPPPGSEHFPVFIRSFTVAGEEPVFVRLGQHGACRGQATPVIETAAEHVSLQELMLIALSWARRNL
jgi:hypothetical protein